MLMVIGMTYDLREDYRKDGYDEEELAECDLPETADAIERALLDLGYTVDRIGRAAELVRRLAKGDRWDLVFNICEGIRGEGREAQVPAILDVYGIPYTFSDPVVMAVSLRKDLTKLILQQADIPTPAFALVREEKDLDGINLRFPLFAKPVAEGTSKGIDARSKVTDSRQLREVCMRLLQKFRQPVLVEEFLPGREFTVGITGTGPLAQVVGTIEIILLNDAEREIYSYANKMDYERRVQYRHVSPEQDPEVAQVEAIALASWRVLGGRDAGRIDLRSDANNHPHVMEINPLPGLRPIHSDLLIIFAALGLDYSSLIDRIVQSALLRIASNR